MKTKPKRKKFKKIMWANVHDDGDFYLHTTKRKAISFKGAIPELKTIRILITEIR